MKSFENVYKELEYLLIQKLPESIEKINKEHNDGIILKPFENKNLEENCIKTPTFTSYIEETEYSEKGYKERPYYAGGNSRKREEMVKHLHKALEMADTEAERESIRMMINKL